MKLNTVIFSKFAHVSKFGKYLTYILFTLLILDFIFKYLLLKNHFEVLNKGIAFSLFSTSNLVLLFHLGALALLTTVYYLLSTKSSWVVNKFYLFLILLAGISNFFDRIAYGGVVDYLNFYFFKNNLSDIVIFVSTLFLVKNIYFKKSLS